MEGRCHWQVASLESQSQSLASAFRLFQSGKSKLYISKMIFYSMYYCWWSDAELDTMVTCALIIRNTNSQSVPVVKCDTNRT